MSPKKCCAQNKGGALNQLAILRLLLLIRYDAIASRASELDALCCEPFLDDLDPRFGLFDMEIQPIS